MISAPIATLRLLSFVAVTLAMQLFYLPALVVNQKCAANCARFYWRVVALLFGIGVLRHGVPTADRPVLFVANHASYLDVIVLGSLLPACFVAKSEVAQWPGFGLLCRIGRTVFVDRSRAASARGRDELRRRLDAGEPLVLVPEGTSNDGNRVLPFKSALFAVAEQPVAGADGQPRALTVQPVSLAYTRLDGLPMPRAFRPFYAWYGGMTLAGHLFEVLGLGNVTVEVIFHPPVTIAAFSGRKEMARHCYAVVNRGVALALAGRLPAATA